jgi:chromosome segregation ATPase
MIEENNVKSEMKGHKTNYMDRLQQASHELDSIKSSFSKGMEDLSRIQGVLNKEGVNNITQMISDYENKIMVSERKKEEALQGAHQYSQELEKEKERLVKLWDAYKNQEEELANKEKKVAEFEERIREVEQSRQKFQEDADLRISTLTQKLEDKEMEISQMVEFKQKATDLEKVTNQLHGEVQTLKQNGQEKEDTIQCLNQRIDELKKLEETAGFKAKFEDLSVEFEKEKERLTKLFRLYEETESENKKLKEEVAEWKRWADKNEEVLSNLFSSMDRLKRNVVSEPATQPPLTPPTPEHSNPPEFSVPVQEKQVKKTKKEKKSRLRLRR